MSFMTAKNIMWHWKNNTKESEKIRFIDVFTAQRIIADRKRISRVFIMGGLLLLLPRKSLGYESAQHGASALSSVSSGRREVGRGIRYENWAPRSGTDRVAGRV